MMKIGRRSEDTISMQSTSLERTIFSALKIYQQEEKTCSRSVCYGEFFTKNYIKWLNI